MKLSQVSAEYFALYGSARISPLRLGEIDGIISQVMMHLDKYQAIEDEAGTPWFVVALIHNLECSLSFERHLHNGDPLARPTVNDPAHRPPGWLELPPAMRTWHRSALDALAYDHLDHCEGWDIAEICFRFEGFNGFGYRQYGVHSPYLWAGSQHYVKGKYVGDHDYDPNAVSKQLGSAVILKRMAERSLIALKGQPV